MLTVTDDAARHLAEILHTAEATGDTAIRFVREGRTISPTLDRERPGDVTYAYAGITVLLLDENVVAELADRTLDVQDSDDGPQLILN
jgi:hypothetical protein